eukprot:scaffold17815_cov89-Skeletonema_dohrnii-CCMP3373.AAC.1
MERDTGYWMNGIAFGFLWFMRDIIGFLSSYSSIMLLDQMLGILSSIMHESESGRELCKEIHG